MYEYLMNVRLVGSQSQGVIHAHSSYIRHCAINNQNRPLSKPLLTKSPHQNSARKRSKLNHANKQRIGITATPNFCSISTPQSPRVRQIHGTVLVRQRPHRIHQQPACRSGRVWWPCADVRYPTVYKGNGAKLGRVLDGASWSRGRDGKGEVAKEGGADAACGMVSDIMCGEGRECFCFGCAGTVSSRAVGL